MTMIAVLLSAFVLAPFACKQAPTPPGQLQHSTVSTTEASTRENAMDQAAHDSSNGMEHGQVLASDSMGSVSTVHVDSGILTTTNNTDAMTGAADATMGSADAMTTKVLEADTQPLPSATLLRLPIRDGKNLAYVSNRDITKAAQTVENALIIVHGLDRNPGVYYDSLNTAVVQQKVGAQTWVIAPFFMQAEDKPQGSDLTWEDGNWRKGEAAKGLQGSDWSSYAALDALVKALDNPLRFSKLKTITLVGFSAGGQFMERYMLGTRISDVLTGFKFRFVVGSPGSYMYPTSERPKNGKSSAFEKPTSCSGYNDYPYGLSNRVDYLKTSAVSDMVARLATRDIRFIAGEADTARDGVLDVTCAADLQGANRFARSQNFAAYAKHLNANDHTKVFSVPGAAHDHAKVFQSTPGRAALFND